MYIGIRTLKCAFTCAHTYANAWHILYIITYMYVLSSSIELKPTYWSLSSSNLAEEVSGAAADKSLEFMANCLSLLFL